ncbi:LysR substrate-binding domain-containing protein [Paraburkholderia humisilvae]|uniref:HTH-type transcriptional regulator HdfR n=1 Tax=Paraburkholderia humisilvae TaxID=627669 RepID=A0A6J5EMJ5_9BURK|nr:LysR substrate-binding domain-containing protein [Paraburkholderia humisilvae]CAB3766927.1 HTH-type transcriptional regulator HdfR [Paraburkholderia humisilvae]
MATLDLDLLRAFITVAEVGSFTAAADVVGRSQSAVSQKVLRLEEFLGLRLMERTSRSLSITPDGERVLVAGRRLLEQYDTFMRDLRKPPQLASLRLGVSENLVQTQLPLLLSRVRERYPHLQLELTTGSSQDLIVNHEAGLLDVVLAKRKREGSPHRGRVIWREPLVWLAGSEFRNDPGRPARLVMMRPPCGYREVMTETLDAAHREWTTVCTASNLVGVQAAVAGGLGVTVLGKSFLQNGMKILPTSAQWPALPTSEVAVIGEDSVAQDIMRPLISLFVEILTESSMATLDATPGGR